jgi:hypothetical protein
MFHYIRAAERESILNSSILYSIKARIEYGGNSNPDDLSLIYRVLTCPNIRELDLSLRWGGCVVSDGQPYAFNFSSSGLAKATLPPLEVLKLSGYELDNKLDGGAWMEWESSKPQRNILLWPWKFLPDNIIERVRYQTVHRPGGIMDYFVKRDHSPLPEDAEINLDGWLERMDWSNIHTLDLKSVSPLVMQKLIPVLTGVTSLTLEYGGGKAGAAYIDFLDNTTKPLKKFVLRNVAFNDFEFLTKTITNRHGSSLQSLELREREDRRDHYVWLEDKSRMVKVYGSHLYLKCLSYQPNSRRLSKSRVSGHRSQPHFQHNSGSGCAKRDQFLPIVEGPRAASRITRLCQCAGRSKNRQNGYHGI